MLSTRALSPWRIWFAAAILATVIFSFTLTSAVPVWFGETFIVESGRLLLAHGDGGPAFHERSDSGRPLYSPALLGSLMQEVAFRVTAPSNAGPRTMAFLGALLASGFLVHYFLACGIRPGLSVILGLAFLLDPLHDISWRGGRVDSWAFAFLFLSMSALRASFQRTGGPSRTAALLAGAAAAAGFFCWPYFALLAPLLLLEFASPGRKPSLITRRALLFASGAAVVAALIVAPFYWKFLYSVADAGLLTSELAPSGDDAIWRQVLLLFLALAWTPVASVFGLIALVRQRNRLLLIGFGVALGLTLATLVYRLRVLYLVPYLYVAVGSLLWVQPDESTGSRWRRLGTWAAACLLLTGIAFTVFGTSLSGLTLRSGKDPLALIGPAGAAIGTGPIRVYLAQADLYFVGRTLGWRQFECFDGCIGPNAQGALQNRLSSMDSAVFRGEPDAVTQGSLAEFGFHRSAVLFPGGGQRSSLLGWHYGPPTYGPYMVYKRTPK